MRHPGIGLVLATGGTAMGKAAYSSGTPAIGVGSGNTPALVCADADLDAAADAIVSSKSFEDGHLRRTVLGRSASSIAAAAGLDAPDGVRVLVAPVDRAAVDGRGAVRSSHRCCRCSRWRGPTTGSPCAARSSSTRVRDTRP